MTFEQSRGSCNSLRICAIILTAAAAWGPSAHAATSNIWASATIVPPVGVAESSDIRFSGFVAGTTPGTITLLVPPALSEAAPTPETPIESSSRRRAGGVRLVGGTNCLAQLNCGVGAVQIGGPASDSFSGVSTEATTTLTSGDNTMTLDGIELRYGANGTAGTVSGSGVLNSAGNGTIVFGGVLNVAAGQAVGTYSGSVTVLVDY